MVMQTIILANGPCHIEAINYSFIYCDICFIPVANKSYYRGKDFKEQLFDSYPARNSEQNVCDPVFEVAYEKTCLNLFSSIVKHNICHSVFPKEYPKTGYSSNRIII